MYNSRYHNHNHMAIMFKCGYDSARKHIINASLHKTTLWNYGTIYINNSVQVCTLNPSVENNIELIKYNDNACLRLNNMIIYDQRELFSYDIQLRFVNDVNDLGEQKQNLYDFIDYSYVNCSNIQEINRLRELN